MKIIELFKKLIKDLEELFDEMEEEALRENELYDDIEER